jgi:arylsulfatase A-like enzyme
MLLKKAGYKVGFAGKYGVGKKQPAAQFDYWACTKKTQPDYMTTDSTGAQVHDTDLVTSHAVEFLDTFAPQGPFCLSLSFKAPHEQDGRPPHFITQPRFDSLYENVTIPTPVTADPVYWNSFPDFFRTDENIARVRWNYLFSTPQLYQENVKKYYRLITGLDQAIGTIMSRVKKLGIEKNTVLIFMGDNGFMLGEHGLEGKWFGYEESIRVPLFIYYPGLPAKLKQTRPGQIALNIDVAPTILSLAGVEVPAQMQGIDLLKMLEQKIPARQDFFYEHTFQKSPQLPRVEGVVTPGLKYMKYIEHNYEELYDTAFDPHETQNLAADPAHAADMTRLRARYEALKQQVK